VRKLPVNTYFSFHIHHL